MKQRKWLSLLMAVLMALGATALAQEQDPFLAALQGHYDELFPTICTPEYDQVWLEACAAYAGEESAQQYAQTLKAICAGSLYGQAAIDAYGANPQSAVFNCSFLEGVAQFIISGNQISGLDQQGGQVFSHSYTAIGTDEASGFALYQSDDAGSGAFSYFAFAPDTPSTTYHIEFRYGETLEDIGNFYQGPYAYWLAAGIPADASPDLIGKCIDLFCSENLGEGE